MPTNINSSGQTFTQHNVVVGGASNTVSGIAPGANGNVLTSDGTDWTSATPAGGGGVSGPGSSTDRAISTWNGTAGAALFDNPSSLIDSAGIATNSAQPSFSAYLGSTSVGVLGGSTTYPMSGLTELFDLGSNFNATTGIFTAPKTARYFFGTTVNISAYGATNTTIDVDILTTALSFPVINNVNPFVTGINGNFGLSGGCFVSMTAGDTAKVNIVVNGSACNLFGAAGGYTTFYGYLVC